MKRKYIYSLFFGIVVIFVLFFISGSSDELEDYVEVRNKKIKIEIADSDKEREKGLMDRKELCNKCGMLFIFDEEEKHSFWMKNTSLPLDIVFIDSDLKVVDIFHAKPCNKEPCKKYVPEKKSSYVLETNINKFNKSIIGEKIDITYNA